MAFLVFGRGSSPISIRRRCVRDVRATSLEFKKATASKGGENED
jgi:hypothetical protein